MKATGFMWLLLLGVFLNPAQAKEDNIPAAVVYDAAYHKPAKDLLLKPEGLKRAEALAHFANGILAENTEGAESANASFLKAFELDPKNTQVALKLTCNFLHQDDPQKAMEILERTLKANPSQAIAHIALAYLIFHTAKDAEKAQTHLEAAIKIDPTNILSYQYGTVILQSVGQNARAEAMLDRAAQVHTANPEFWLRLGQINAAHYLRNDSMSEVANDPHLPAINAIFLKALQFAGNDNQPIFEQAADFFIETRQFAFAVPLYERIIELDPTNAIAAGQLARCLLENVHVTNASVSFGVDSLSN